MSEKLAELNKRYMNLRKADMIPTRDAICAEAEISIAVFYNLLRGTTTLTKPFIKIFEQEFAKLENRYLDETKRKIKVKA